MRDRKVQPRHKAGRRSGSIQSLFLDIAQGLCAIAYGRDRVSGFLQHAGYGEAGGAVVVGDENLVR